MQRQRKYDTKNQQVARWLLSRYHKARAMSRRCPQGEEIIHASMQLYTAANNIKNSTCNEKTVDRVNIINSTTSTDKLSDITQQEQQENGHQSRIRADPFIDATGFRFNAAEVREPKPLHINITETISANKKNSRQIRVGDNCAE